MKPAFALTFSDTGISLNHHSDDEWYCIGTVPLDASDVTDQLQRLWQQGFALENDLSCTVVIPSEQVRYFSVETGGLSAEDAQDKILTALQEATPYALSDLVYAAKTNGAQTEIAAVAAETVEEARTFAEAHGFVPAQFTACDTDADAPVSLSFLLSQPDPQAVSPESAIAASDVDTVPEAQAPAAAVASVPGAVADDTGAAPSDQEVKADEGAGKPAPPPAAHPIADSDAPVAFQSLARDPARRDLPTAASLSHLPVKRLAIPAIAATVLLALGLGAWSLMSSDAPQEVTVASAEDAADETAQTGQPSVSSEPPEDVAQPLATQAPQPDEAQPEPELTPTDAAILEALQTAPQAVEEVARDPEAQEVFHEVTGLATTPPTAPAQPAPEPSDDTYLASIDRSDLSQDAVALPPVQSFDTDNPVDQAGLPSIAGTRFTLDERGLVTPTAEGTLNPDGVRVFLGRPSSVPPEVPVRFETEPVTAEVDPRLAEIRPRPRPGDIVERFERQQLGGRSVAELAVLRPKLRPKSIQDRPQVDDTPTALAVVRVPRPRVRPATVAALAARKQAGAGSAPLGSVAAVAPKDDEAGSFQPKAVAPKIPSTASVARQATIDNAINLRQLNLIGVYGSPANRRALVRLPSGRYKKVKVGDRIDGGNVIAIGDSELRYQKRGRNVTLKMPRG